MEEFARVLGPGEAGLTTPSNVPAGPPADRQPAEGPTVSLTVKCGGQ